MFGSVKEILALIWSFVVVGSLERSFYYKCFDKWLLLLRFTASFDSVSQLLDYNRLNPVVSFFSLSKFMLHTKNYQRDRRHRRTSPSSQVPFICIVFEAENSSNTFHSSFIPFSAPRSSLGFFSAL
jgi:hypothetical protein